MPALIPTVQHAASVPLAPGPGFDLAAAGLGKKTIPLNVSTGCEPTDSLAEVVVCGHSGPNSKQRLGELDTRFGNSSLLLPDGRLTLPLPSGFILEGGGSKGSVGLTLTRKF